MTIEIRHNCGGRKFGAWVLCRSRGAAAGPDRETLALPEHFQTPDGLGDLALQIKAGVPLCLTPGTCDWILSKAGFATGKDRAG